MAAGVRMSALGEANELAWERLYSLPHEPLFIADWERVLMIHYEVDPQRLQTVVPLPLDVRERRAFVSLVAFSMRGMRPRFGGRPAAWLLKPIATHDFLNLRAYVRHRDQAGIFFLTEWLSSRLSVWLGPAVFGLPYRFGQIRYDHGKPGAQSEKARSLTGCVKASPRASGFSFHAILKEGQCFKECGNGTLDEFLMERYTAYTCRNGQVRFFRVWHQPWMQTGAQVEIIEDGLIRASWPFMADARIIGASYSPGAFGVQMGWPHRLPCDDFKQIGARSMRPDQAGLTPVEPCTMLRHLRGPTSSGH